MTREEVGKLLAVIRDKIFRALRVLCPAKLESKQKGAIIAMLTALGVWLESPRYGDFY